MEDIEHGFFNQEALSKIDDLDLTIRLPDINPTQNKTTENGLCEITQVLRDRLEFSKKRESLIHGNRTGRYPSWYGVNTKCFLNLPNKQEDEKFRGFWKELTDAIKKQASQKVIDFLSNQIKEKENEANRIRTETIKKIGFATQESSSIRKQLDKEFTSDQSWRSRWFSEALTFLPKMYTSKDWSLKFSQRK